MVVKEVLVWGKGIVEGLVAISPFERDKELLNWDSVSYPIKDRVPLGVRFCHLIPNCKVAMWFTCYKIIRVPDPNIPNGCQCCPFATDSLVGSADEYNAPSSPGGYLIKCISCCQNSRSTSRGVELSFSSSGTCAVYGER